MIGDESGGEPASYDADAPDASQRHRQPYRQ